MSYRVKEKKVEKIKAADAIKRENLHNSSSLERFWSNEEEAEKSTVCQVVDSRAHLSRGLQVSGLGCTADVFMVSLQRSTESLMCFF